MRYNESKPGRCARPPILQEVPTMEQSYRIAVAGIGYVGLANAILLAQHNRVTAVDVLPQRVQALMP